MSLALLRNIEKPRELYTKAFSLTRLMTSKNQGDIQKSYQVAVA